ncbi:hypothetical protein BKA70DRAFT_1223271 [Coprinopsis sp. MPI-PUGE-AT-0042]|nr:hypothetical protein BKA70DRAFT_1223271 [Coprinopsis sp. MPI-PUGE-AT-0042]
MPLHTRRVLLDNDSPALKYSGLWHAASDPSAHYGSLRTTIATTGSIMTFELLGLFASTFRMMGRRLTGWPAGTEIVLSGIAKWGSGGQAPTATCTVDSTDLDSPTPSKYFKCSWSGEESTDGGKPHVFRIEVSIPEGSGNDSAATSISIDTLQCLPSPDSGDLKDRDRKALVIYNFDVPISTIRLGIGKRLDPPGEGVVVTEVGASATVLFTGSTHASSGSERSSGQYWLYSGEPVNFILAPGPEAVPPISTCIGKHSILDTFERCKRSTTSERLDGGAGITAAQGINIAGHNVYNTTNNNHYYPAGEMATGIGIYGFNTSTGDEWINSHWLQPQPEHRLPLGEAHESQQAIEVHRPNPVDAPRLLHAQSEEDSHIHGSS